MILPIWNDDTNKSELISFKESKEAWVSAVALVSLVGSLFCAAVYSVFF